MKCNYAKTVENRAPIYSKCYLPYLFILPTFYVTTVKNRWFVSLNQHVAKSPSFHTFKIRFELVNYYSSPDLNI